MGSGERFDSVARFLGSTLSRRRALKLALGAGAGMAGAGAMVAYGSGVAGAQCLGGCLATEQCCTTNVVPTPSFCAPLGFQCCGNSACAPGFTCCTTAVPNFCAPPLLVCCGAQACSPFVSQCCQTGAAPHCEPVTFQCCGDTACPPFQTCVGYPAPSHCA